MKTNSYMMGAKEAVITPHRVKNKFQIHSKNIEHQFLSTMPMKPLIHNNSPQVA
jgi:hypothetical protein